MQHGALYGRDFTTFTERTHDEAGDATIANDGSGTQVLGLGARTRRPTARPCDRTFAEGVDSTCDIDIS